MKPKEFIKKVKSGDVVKIKGEKYKVIQKILWLMLVSDDSYYKYVLEDKNGCRDYRLAPDEENGRYLFCKMFANNLTPPFPKKIKIYGLNFNYTYGEWCRVKKVWGEKVYQIGDEEIWWDYEDKKDNYLSIGWDEKTGEREDLIGEWIKNVSLI
ncbi:DUF4178 domain-containing protein [Patescibacteria group bacterium]|nr:DUF4178 domain-containing protein [Patescibacteria group bacterium]MBU1931764.1 DUF4178 domain-containing protein [Patescibacteria group bacterium]